MKNFTRSVLVKDQIQEAFYRSLGARIREIRGVKLSQEQLAKAAKLSRTSIVNIECGKQKLLVYNLFQISKALGIQPSELIGPLEPTTGKLPDFHAEGDDREWIKRSLKKAMHSHAPK